MADIDVTDSTPSTKTTDEPGAEETHVEKEDTSVPPAGETHTEEIEDPSTASADEIAQKYERLRKKVSGIEKEKSKLESAARVLAVLNDAAAKDPKFAKDANEKLYNAGLITKEQFDQLSSTIEDNKSGRNEPNKVTDKTTDGSDRLSELPELNWVREKQMEETRKQEEFFAKFEEGKEDISDGSEDDARQRRIAIGNVATVNMSKGMSQEDAYELAYKQILHPEKIAEDGELQGLIKARSASPSIAPASGGSSTSTSVTLTDEQLDAARRMKMSPEEYAEAQDPSFGQDII